MDENRHRIEGSEWLSDADQKLIFEDNAKRLFKLDVSRPVNAGAAA